MTRYPGSAGYCLCIAVGALLLAGAQPTDHKYSAKDYSAKDYFAEPKVAELAEAASKGDVERVDQLISQGVKVNARGKEGMTPLMYSMTRTSTKGLQRLLERGADANLQTQRGESAVSFAAHRQESESLKLLLAHGGNPNLFSRPAPPYSTYDVTPIYDAIAGRNPENARILIKAGADLSVRNSAGWTPLMGAAIDHAYEVMYVLLEAAADFRATDPWGHSAIYFLLDVRIDPKSDVFKSRQKCMKFLETKGVDFEKEKLRNAEIDRQNEERRKRTPRPKAVGP